MTKVQWCRNKEREVEGGVLQGLARASPIILGHSWFFTSTQPNRSARRDPVSDFLNDAPFEDLEKILEILRYKVQGILYFEPYVAFLSRQDTDSEV